MIDLSIVVVPFKEDREVWKRCLDSVKASTGLTFEFIAIDNANRPETEQLTKEILPAAKYLANPENRGFAYAVNQGIRQAVGRHILLLNPDTAFAPDVLAKMVAHLDADKAVGIASCVIRYPDGRLQESIRRFPTLWNQIIVLSKLPHLFKHLPSVDRYMMADADPYKTQDVDSLMGAFFFIKREVIEKIGLLDERYFIWFEEVDYCKMAHDAGFKIRHYADVEITHHKGHSFSKVATLRKQRWIRQSLRKYLLKHHGFVTWLILWALTPEFYLLGHVASWFKKS